MFWKNKTQLLIDQYEARISELKAQLSDLRGLVFPSTVPGGIIPLVNLEADAVMNAREERIDISEREFINAEDALSERDRILAGNY